MDIGQLQYLVALAREKHFTRAAKACHVTQPTLSGRIRQLEQELGVPIVERGQRFIGFTPDGECVLKWAHTILDNWTSLQLDIAQRRDGQGALRGHLSVGVIPSALPMAALMAKAIHARHPEVELTILSSSSIDILRQLEEFTIDVGFSYLDNEPVEGMRGEPIYMERYCLLVRAGHELASAPSVSWADAAKEPLCLLTPDMQNRRIIDRALRSVGAEATPSLTSNSLLVLYTHVKTGRWASVMPAKLAETLGLSDSVRSIPIVDPVVDYSVGLVIPQRDPMTPLIAALVQVAREVAPTLE